MITTNIQNLKCTGSLSVYNKILPGIDEHGRQFLILEVDERAIGDPNIKCTINNKTYTFYANLNTGKACRLNGYTEGWNRNIKCSLSENYYTDIFCDKDGTITSSNVKCPKNTTCQNGYCELLPVKLQPTPLCIERCDGDIPIYCHLDTVRNLPLKNTCGHGFRCVEYSIGTIGCELIYNSTSDDVITTINLTSDITTPITTPITTCSF